MSHTQRPVRLPGNAVGPEDGDIAGPAQDLLMRLRLLGTDDDIQKAGSLLTWTMTPG
jgi:hypothetical protein